MLGNHDSLRTPLLATDATEEEKILPTEPLADAASVCPTERVGDIEESVHILVSKLNEILEIISKKKPLPSTTILTMSFSPARTATIPFEDWPRVLDGITGCPKTVDDFELEIKLSIRKPSIALINNGISLLKACCDGLKENTISQAQHEKYYDLIVLILEPLVTLLNQDLLFQKKPIYYGDDEATQQVRQLKQQVEAMQRILYRDRVKRVPQNDYIKAKLCNITTTVCCLLSMLTYGGSCVLGLAGKIGPSIYQITLPVGSAWGLLSCVCCLMSSCSNADSASPDSGYVAESSSLVHGVCFNRAEVIDLWEKRHSGTFFAALDERLTQEMARFPAAPVQQYM